VDWNGDNKKDLLAGDAFGYITIFLNTGTNANPVLTNSGQLQVGGNTLNVIGKATPCVDDWNGDGLFDLLVGEEDGRIALLINSGSPGNPQFAAMQYVQARGADLDVSPGPEDRSVPEVVDLDGDGIKDLLVGEINGVVHFYSNSGTNTNPQFNSGVVLQTAAGDLDVGNYSRPEITDWDEDGDPDLLVGEEMGYVHLFINPGTSAIKDPAVPKQLPTGFQLFQNYPNPFNPATSIRFTIPKSEDVAISIYNTQGKLISVLVNQPLNAGSHEVKWSAAALPSGIYFAVLKAGLVTRQVKMCLLR